MAFFLTRGGAIIKIDVPEREGHALERHEEALANGDIVPVDDDSVEEYVDGTETLRDGSVAEYRKLRLKAPAEEPEKPRRRASVKDDAETVEA